MTIIDHESLHVVLGAGPVGMGVARRLRSLLQPVRLVNRGQSLLWLEDRNVQRWKADLRDPNQTQDAVRDARVVYLCVGARQGDRPEDLVTITDNVITACGITGARLVVAGGMDVYGPAEGPVAEDHPLAAKDPLAEAYGDATQKLLKAHEAGRVTAVIGRAGDLYGPFVMDAPFGRPVFGRVLSDLAVMMMGDWDEPHTVTFIEDFARGLIRLAGEESAWGQVWHVPSDETLTRRGFVEAVFAEQHHRPKLARPLGWRLRMKANRDRAARAMLESQHRFRAPFMVDHTKFADAFGDDDVTAHKLAIELTLEWFARFFDRSEAAALRVTRQGRAA